MTVAVLVTATLWSGILAASLRGRLVRQSMVILPGLIGLALAWLTWVTRGALLALEAGEGPARRVWTEENVAEGVVLLALAGAAMTAGSVAGLHASRSENGARSARSRLAVPFAAALAVAAGALALFAVVYGPGDLLLRDRYNADYAVPALASIVILLPPLAATASTAALRSARTPGQRWAAVAVLVAGALTMFGTGSRNLGIYFGVVLLTAVALESRLRATGRMALVVLTLLGVALPVQLRGSDVGHGLIPYAGLLGNVGELPHIFVSSAANLAFSVPLLGHTSRVAAFGAHELGVSISPLDGTAAGWAELAPELRVHTFIPYSGLGELTALSPWLMVGFCVVLGFIAARVVLLLADHPAFAAVAIALYLYIFSLLLQYNLRSSMRLVYAIVGVSVAFWLARWLRSVAARDATHDRGAGATAPRRAGVAR